MRKNPPKNMQTKTPKISVIMPTLNSAQYIQHAIDSILLQTISDWELIIIDGGSKDGTLKLIENYSKKDKRIILIKEKNSSVSSASNFGLRKAKADLTARMDSDDICYPTRLSTQLSFLQNNPEIGVVGSYCTAINDTGQTLYEMRPPTKDKQLKKFLYFKCPFFHPSIMARKKLLVDAGGYNKHFTIAEDYELWARLSTKTKFANIPKPLLYYRKHSQNLSYLQFEKTQSAKKLISKYLEKNNKIPASWKIEKFIGDIFSSIITTPIRKLIWTLPRAINFQK